MDNGLYQGLNVSLVKEPTEQSVRSNNAKARTGMEGNTFVICVPLDELECTAASEPEHGRHKWIWLDVDTGLRDGGWLDGLTLNERELTVSAQEKEMCGNEDGHFIFCVPTEAFVRNDRTYKLKIKKDGAPDASVDIKVRNTSAMKVAAYLPTSEQILKAEERAKVPAFNNGSSVLSAEGNVFTICTPLDELKPSISVVYPERGMHSWIWVDIDTGLRSDDWNGSEEKGDRLSLNGMPVMASRTEHAGEVSGKLSGDQNGHTTIYLPVDVIEKEPKTFLLTKPGYKPAAFTVKVKNTSNQSV